MGIITLCRSGEIRWDNRDSLTSVFMVNSEAVKIAAGYIGGREVALGNVTIAMDSTPYNWATITLTALDGRSIDDSEKILLVAAGRVENSNMGWDDAYTTVGADWGEAPTRVEGIPAKILIKDTKRFKAYALDAAGNLGEGLPVRRSGGEQSLVIGAQYNTLWYILKR